MGTTAQKLEYLGTTKSQLKDMINYGLPTDEQITSSTTFRNYVSSIFNAFLEALRTPDTLFTNLPKKSGTGANITLNDTANAPMRIELSASELTQASTPTPSSPQDIHTISGSNKVVVLGSNIIGNVAKKQYRVNLKAGDKITVHANETNTIWLYTNYGDETRNDYWTLSEGQTRTITITQDSQAIAWVYNITGNSWINYGDTLLPYEPYTSQEADIDLGYENLLDMNFSNEASTVGGVRFIHNKSSFTLKGTPTSTYKIFNLKNIPNVKNGETYTLTANIKGTNPRTQIQLAFRNSSSQTITGYTVNTPTTTTQTKQLDLTNVTNAVFIIEGLQTGQYYDLEAEVMFNKGSTALPYTPTDEAIEYCKIGNYEDKFIRSNDGTWQLEKNIGKVVLDGTEDWNSINTGMFTLYNFLPSIKSNNVSLSNYFTFNNITSGFYAGLQDGEYGIQPNTNQPNNIHLKNMSISSIADFKTWLSSHNTTVYYVLATPTYTPITGTLAEQLENVYKKMLSYSGTTNISQVNNDLAFNMNVSALEDLT